MVGSPKIDQLKNLSSHERDRFFSELQKILTKTKEDTTIPRCLSEDDIPLSFSQQRLWFLHQLEPDCRAYHIFDVLRIRRSLNYHTLNQGIDEVVRRHSSLRTVFGTKDGNPIQKIQAEMHIEPRFIDLSKFDMAEVQNRIEKYVRFERKWTFNLEKGPLLYIALLKTSDQEHILMIMIHHIVSDGWSCGILTSELASIFNRFGEGKISILDDPPIQYADYAVWQRSRYNQKEYDEDLLYWKRTLANLSPSMPLLTDYRYPVQRTYRGQLFNLSLPSSLTRQVKDLGRFEDATDFMVLCTVLGVLLFRYSGQSDIVIGTGVANRNKAELEEVIGFFINMIILRIDLSGNPIFTDLLGRVRKIALEAYEHQELPFERLVDALQPERNLSQTPLFQIALERRNIPKKNSEFKELSITSLDIDTGTASYDLEMHILDDRDTFFICFRYNTDLFNSSTISRIAHHFKRLLEGIVLNKNEKISDLPLLNESERQKILQDGKPVVLSSKSPLTISQLFEAQASKRPDSIALVFGQQQLSYALLNAKANQLAHYLKKRGACSGSITALLMDKSPEMVTALLGILKTGAAYLPIDIHNPIERINDILDDSGATILLTEKKTSKETPFTQLKRFADVTCSIISTKDRDQIKDLDRLPFPDRTMVDYRKYDQYIGDGCLMKYISLISTRGCPYHCLYCHNLWPKKHVIRSAENVYEEVKFHYDHGYRSFSFLDDIFNLDRRNSERFFQLIIKNKLSLRIQFPAGLRGDILTPDYIDLMAEAGVMNFAVALETASPRLQKLIRKNIDIDQLRNNIQYVCETYPEIILDLFMMYGFPTETEEEVVMTLDFVKQIKWIHFPILSALKIFPNTNMARLAIEQGVTKTAIARSADRAYHEIGETMPFAESFSRKIQVEIMDYFLLPERLQTLIPIQKRILTQDELIAKYNSYLPGEIKNYPEIFDLIGEDAYYQEKEVNHHQAVDQRPIVYPSGNNKTYNSKDVLNLLLIDLSQYFSHETDQLGNVVEAPLGLMYLATYLKQAYGDKINVGIVKAMIDFDCYEELKNLVENFNPHLIGIRTLSLYREFFHQTVTLLKQWHPNVPIVTGGPYATSEYDTILSDKNIDAVIRGEGEITLCELVGAVIDGHGDFPERTILEKIDGISFIPRQSESQDILTGKNQELCEVILLDKMQSYISDGKEDNLICLSHPAELAYVIYTSGSTGKPKGVMIEHRNVTRLFDSTESFFKFTSEDTWTLFHSYAFDFSVWEMWGSLLHGGRLVIVPFLTSRSPEEFYSLMLREQVTILNQTPSAFRSLLQARNGANNDALRFIIFGGEKLDSNSIRPWLNHGGIPNASLINMYGITETTVHVTYYCIDQANDHLSYHSIIGKKLPDLQLNILDEKLQPVPDKFPGEIYIGGEGCARGYLNRSSLTAERFIPNPYDPEKTGARLYKSGDRARYRSDGNLEYLGRNDTQIKLRGYRIELGEIESVLRQHEAVQDVAALIIPIDQEKRLVAYIVPDAEKAYVVCTLAEWQAEGKLNPKSYYELPNDMVIIHQNEKETEFSYREIFKEQRYLRNGIKVRPGDCVFDVGSNIGLFTLFIGTHFHDIKIYAFEPIPLLYEMLYLNTTLYRIKAMLFQCALSNKKGEGTFIYYPDISVLSGRYADSESEKEAVKTFLLNQAPHLRDSELVSSMIDDHLHSMSFKCPMRTISEVIRQERIERINLLKIDVEKSEQDVLDGIEDQDWQKIDQIVIEVHDANNALNKIKTLLQGCGYVVIVEQNPVLKSTGLYNVYAIRQIKNNLIQRKTSWREDVTLKHRWTSRTSLLKSVRRFAEARLPNYMVPAMFEMVNCIPLTTNNKIDIKALPDICKRRVNRAKKGRIPSTEVEKALAKIWCDVLDLSEVDVQDNFFELGGDSILSILIIAKVNQLGFKLTPRQMFQHQTIAELSKVVGSLEINNADQKLITGQVPLTPIQHWFFEQDFPEMYDFSQSLYMEVLPHVHSELCRQAFGQLVVHHDALRMRFVPAEHTWEQYNAGLSEKEIIMVVDLSLCGSHSKSIQDQLIHEVQVSLNLSEGPIIRGVYFSYETGRSAQFLIVVHHLVIDGVSWRVLVEDMIRCFEGLCVGEAISLQPKTTSFKIWSERLTEYAQRDLAYSQEDMDLWTLIDKKVIPAIPVDKDRELSLNTFSSIDSISIGLNERETQFLLEELPKAYHTQIDDVLLASLLHAYWKWSSIASLLVALEGHGREDIFDEVELSRTVGWFTTIYPVFLELQTETDMGEILKSVKEQLRRYKKCGFSYGILQYLYHRIEVRNKLKKLQKPQISFNYLGQLGQSFSGSSWVRLVGKSFGYHQSLKAVRPFLLTVNGMVADRKLVMYFEYNTEVHKTKTMESLATNFMESLRSFITYCERKDKQEFTPSDFPLADLDQIELDKVITDLDTI